MSWVWTVEGGNELYFDLGEVVRFRVEAEEWHDQSPQGPGAEESSKDKKPPYSLIVGQRSMHAFESHANLTGINATVWARADDVVG